MSTNAARSLQDNEDYMDYYKRRLNNIGEKEYNQLQDIYRNTIDPGQRVVNPDGTISIVGGEIDSPQKLAMADAILQGKSMAQKGTKDILDRALANERAINKIYISQAGRGGRNVELADYDIFKRYEPKYQQKTIVVKPASFFGRKEETKDIQIVPYNEVDVNDKKLIGDVRPVVDKTGDKYYIVREDGDWELS